MSKELFHMRLSGTAITEEMTAGVEAFKARKFQADNPYEKGTQQYFDWDLGWCNAEGYYQWANGEITFDDL